MQTTNTRDGIIWSASAPGSVSALGSAGEPETVAFALPSVSALSSLEYPSRCNSMTGIGFPQFRSITVCLQR
jgi:hypothetical protein